MGNSWQFIRMKTPYYTATRAPGGWQANELVSHTDPDAQLHVSGCPTPRSGPDDLTFPPASRAFPLARPTVRDSHSHCRRSRSYGVRADEGNRDLADVGRGFSPPSADLRGDRGRQRCGRNPELARPIPVLILGSPEQSDESIVGRGDDWRTLRCRRSSEVVNEGVGPNAEDASASARPPA